MKPAPSNILIVNIRLIGDVILTTPLIGILKDAYPDATIDFLVNRGTGEFLEKDPRVRNVIYAGDNEPGSPKKKGGYLSKIFRRYDLAINMNASDRGSLAILFASTKWRAGLFYGDQFWKDIWKRLLYSHPIPYPFPIHYARVCQVVAERLGIQVSKLEAKVFWDDKDSIRVSSILEREKVTGPFFVIHPFARWRYKYWQMEKFAAVSDELAKRYNLQPVWTSSPSKDEQIELTSTSELCQIKPVLIPGELSLNQMAGLLSQASFYLGLDTAISHIAATTGIPMVTLYGPTIVDWWSPWNNNGPLTQQCPLPRGKQRTGNIIVIQKEMKCIPCGQAGCNNSGEQSPCMLDIGPDEVILAVDELLIVKRVEP